MSFHFRYGGSTAKRTLRCPGWVPMYTKLAKERGVTDKSSPDADRGSMLHEACELLIKEDLEYEDLLTRGVKFNGVELTEELLDTKVVPAIEALEEVIDTYGITKLVTEELVEYSDLIGGTIDLTGEAPKVLFFGDYKFGEGIIIDAEGNDQLLFYGWTKISTAEFSRPLDEYEKIVLAIIQPADRREEPLDVWEVELDDLLDFGERFLAAVDIAEAAKPGEELCTGDHCRFCPANGLGDCPAKVNEANFNLEQLRKLDGEYLPKDSLVTLNEVMPQELDITKLSLSQALDLVEALEPLTKDVRKFACKTLELGTEIDGYKLVMKRVTKRWANTDHITKYLKRKLGAANAMVAKVITPAQALKVAKSLDVKLRLKDHIDATSSGTTLARESDKRKAVLSQAKIAEQLELLEDKGGEEKD